MPLILNRSAMLNRRRRFAQAQDYVDKTCLEKMQPFVPVARKSWRNAGKLRDSGKISEPGRIVYTARFARKDYYATVNHRNGGNPNARRCWFAFVKSQHKHEIGAGAAKIMGAKYRK
jgi:hypothetical protein